MTNLPQISNDIVKLSLEKTSDDDVRNIYSVLLDLNIEVGELMKQIRKQERNNE